MMAKFNYFTRETLISLRRNLLMTLAGILTVTVSLFLFGGIMLLSRVVDHGTAKWKGGVEEEIYMKVDATQSQIDGVQARLTADRDVKTLQVHLEGAGARRGEEALQGTTPTSSRASAPPTSPRRSGSPRSERS